jgi:adenylate cyclase
MSQTRRLAAILAADVAGYSRLMGADEEGTLERLKALRRELLDPKIAEHHGRIVKTTGVVDLSGCSISENEVRMRVQARSPTSTPRGSAVPAAPARSDNRCPPTDRSDG